MSWSRLRRLPARPPIIDCRCALREIETFARALAAKAGIGRNGNAALPPARTLDGTGAREESAGASRQFAGDRGRAAVGRSARAGARDQCRAGQCGQARCTTPSRLKRHPVNQLESLRELCADMDAGQVDTLLIVGGNPVYDAPHDFDFATKLQEGAQLPCISARHFDETAEYCQWHVRGVALSGSLGRCTRVRRHDQRHPAADRAAVLARVPRTSVLAAFSDKPGVSAYDAVRDRLKTVQCRASISKSSGEDAARRRGREHGAARASAWLRS